MRTTWIALALAAALAAALTACTAESGGNGVAPSTPETRAAMGREWFRSYCVSCHGVRGVGDGPVAASLVQRPADLTRIALRQGGRFEAAQIAAFIDGRERVAAHGPGDMPVWGRTLDDRLFEGLGDETKLTGGAISLIVEYLRSIQEAAPQ